MIIMSQSLYGIFRVHDVQSKFRAYYDYYGTLHAYHNLPSSLPTFHMPISECNVSVQWLLIHQRSLLHPFTIFHQFSFFTQTTHSTCQFLYVSMNHLKFQTFSDIFRHVRTFSHPIPVPESEKKIRHRCRIGAMKSRNATSMEISGRAPAMLWPLAQKISNRYTMGIHGDDPEKRLNISIIYVYIWPNH